MNIGLLVMMGAVAVSIGLLLFSSLAFKAFKRIDARRSPLHGKKLVHLPGQQLLERISDHEEQMQLAATCAYFAIPISVLAWATLQIDWSAVTFGWVETVFAVFALTLFAWEFRSYTRHWSKRAQARDGLVAERMTGVMLNRLIGPDCIVAHDLPCESFNIDHVVISSRGVYAVETKSFRKKKAPKEDAQYRVLYDGEVLRFPGWVDRKSIEQARDQAQWLNRYLGEALGRAIPVIPAVALPGWWIDKTDAAKNADVRVFTPMGKGADILLYGPELIDASTRTLVAQALALRYPVIADD